MPDTLCPNCCGRNRVLRVKRNGRCPDCGADLRELLTKARRAAGLLDDQADSIEDLTRAYRLLNCNRSPLAALVAEEIRGRAEVLCRIENERTEKR